MLKPVFESRNGQDQGHVDQEEGEFSSPDIPSSSSDASSSPRRSKRLQEKCSSSPAQVVTATATLLSFATGATAIIVCALLFFAVVVCCWIRTKNIRRSKRSHSQLLDVLRRRTDPVPEPDFRARPGCARPSAPSSAPDKWLRTPTGWTSIPEAYQIPASSQYGSHSCPTLSSRQLSTTVDTTHSANVGFLAAAGNTRVAQSFSPTIPGLNWSSGNRDSLSLIPPQTPSSAGLRGTKTTSVNLPARLPVRLPLSPRPPSDTALLVPSPAHVLAGPPTRTPLSPRLLYTSQKKASVPLSDQKIGKVRPGLVSTPTESRLLPHSSLKAYNTVSSRRPGSVYGLRVVF